MTTINDLAAIIAGNTDTGNLRFRQGVITAVASDGTCTVKIAGSDVEITEVKVAAHVCPIPGATCWIATDGTDLFVNATISPQGPAYGSMRRNIAGSVSSGSFVNVSFATRTESQSNGTTLGSSGITIIVPGWYTVTCSPAFENTSATGGRIARMVVNGSVVWDGTLATPGSTAIVPRFAMSVDLQLAIGDVVGYEVWQNSGVSIPLNVSAGQNVLRAVWRGPVAPNLA